MPSPVPHATIAAAVLELFDETFERVQGIYLDSGTSLVETLAGTSAEQASTPMGRHGATIAAHVAHVIYYLDIMERYLQTGEGGVVDWGEVWRTVHVVDAQAWIVLQTRLRETDTRIRTRLADTQDWGAPDRLALALAAVVHSAHHLGEIRQALAWIRA